MERGFGIALLALAAALRPMHDSVAAPVFQPALIYNALIALSLAIVRHMGGLILWAAVVLHAVLAVLLVTTWRGQHPKKTNARLRSFE